MALRRHKRRAAPSIYKLCSLFLQYPDPQLLGAREDLVEAVAELPRSAAQTALERFCEWWKTADALALCQHYVECFDLDKRCGLYLTFYGEGDKRQRGEALLRLKRLYRAAGLPLDQNGELPDFLPVMLEFAWAAQDGRGEIVLRELRAELELLRASLQKRSTPYADVVEAVCETVGEPSVQDRARAAAVAAGGPPQELVGLEPYGPAEVTPEREARK